MPAPTGFEWSVRKSGEIAIRHHGRDVTVVRGRTAERLAERLTSADVDGAQQLLARATGNYKRGNERT